MKGGKDLKSVNVNENAFERGHQTNQQIVQRTIHRSLAEIIV